MKCQIKGCHDKSDWVIVYGRTVPVPPEKHVCTNHVGSALLKVPVQIVYPVKLREV